MMAKIYFARNILCVLIVNVVVDLCAFTFLPETVGFRNVFVTQPHVDSDYIALVLAVNHFARALEAFRGLLAN